MTALPMASRTRAPEGCPSWLFNKMLVAASSGMHLCFPLFPSWGRRPHLCTRPCLPASCRTPSPAPTSGAVPSCPADAAPATPSRGIYPRGHSCIPFSPPARSPASLTSHLCHLGTGSHSGTFLHHHLWLEPPVLILISCVGRDSHGAHLEDSTFPYFSQRPMQLRQLM